MTHAVTAVTVNSGNQLLRRKCGIRGWGGPEKVISRSAGRSKPQQCLLGWPTTGPGNLGKFYLKTDGMQLLTVIHVSVLLVFFFKIALKNNRLLL